MSEAWTLGRLLDWAMDFLRKQGSASPRLDAQVLLTHVTGLDRVRLYVDFERPLVDTELARFKDLVKRRARGEPVAYIVGVKEFYGRDFAVDTRVLVPRPETELLVDAAKAYLRESSERTRIVDVGVGSGAIAVSLAAELRTSHSELVAVGIDASADALEVAAQNAERHGVRDRVKLVRGQGTEPIKSPQSVDVLVSNPPYLDAGLMATLPRDVRDFEPHLALSGGSDGLEVLRPLISDAPRVLRAGGWLGLEVAGEAQAAQVVALLEATGAFEPASVIKDYAQFDRHVVARRRAV